MNTLTLSLCLLTGCLDATSVVARERTLDALCERLLPRKVWTREVLAEAKRQGRVRWANGMLAVVEPQLLEECLTCDYGIARQAVRSELGGWHSEALVWLVSRGRAGRTPTPEQAADLGWVLRESQLGVAKSLSRR